MVKESGTILPSPPSSSYLDSEVSWKAIWQVDVPGRVKHFVWKLKHNAIASRLNLGKRRITSEVLCPICHNGEETIEHIFFLCPWTIWFGLQLCPVPSHLIISHFGDWFDSILNANWCVGEDRKTLVCYIMLTLWQIWKARNAKLFEEKDPNPTWVLHAIKISYLKSQNNISTLANVSWPIPIQRKSQPHWRSPRGNLIKFNIDAHFNLASRKGFEGVVARQNLGYLVVGSRGFMKCPLWLQKG